MKCRECGGRLILHEEGYYVCERCGLIHTEDRVFSVEEAVRERGVDGEHIFHGSYVFSTKNEESTSLVRLQIDLATSPGFMAVQRYRRILRILQYKLGFSEKVTSEVLRDFNKFVYKWRRDKSLPRSYAGIIVALLYLRLKKNNINVTLRDVVGAFKEYGKKVSEADVLKAISFLRKNGYIITTRYFSLDELSKQVVLLLKRANIISGEEYKETAERATKLLKSIGTVPGRSSRSLYIAVAYLVANSFRQISYREFSRKTGIPLSTLRENVVYIRKRLATSEAA